VTPPPYILRTTFQNGTVMCNPVWTRPGAVNGASTLSGFPCFQGSKSVWYGGWYERAGRLTAQNGGFRPGQYPMPNGNHVMAWQHPSSDPGRTLRGGPPLRYDSLCSTEYWDDDGSPEWRAIMERLQASPGPDTVILHCR
jgi:hypothetical protein